MMNKLLQAFRATPAKLLAVLLLALPAITVASVAVASPASASSTVCKTLQLSKQSYTYTPRLTVPVCYNGSQIWQNGGITPGATLIGWSNGGYSWVGSYNDSGRHWLGVGENFTMAMSALGITAVSISCAPRWYLNAYGQVTSSEYGC
jgi:hypothetical protein